MSLPLVSKDCGSRNISHVSRLIRTRTLPCSSFISHSHRAALHISQKQQSAASQTFTPNPPPPFPFPRAPAKPMELYRRDVRPLGSHLEWDQVTPRRYERAIDDMERFYNLQQSVTAHHGVHNWMMSNGIKVNSNSPTLVEDVKRVWIALRYQHPSLASQIEGNRWVYEVPDEAELGAWLQETFFVHDTEKTSRELYPELPTRPLKRAVLHFLPRTQEVVLQSPHTHMDGMGVVLWYDNFLRALTDNSSPTHFGDEGKNLLPAMTPIAHIPKFTTSQQSRWDANAQDWLSNHPTINLETQANSVPGKSTMQWLRFSPSDTQKILAAVKSHSITVSSASQAAVSHAARIHGSTPDKDSCATLALYDAREYISPKYPRASLVGPHTFATPIKFRLGSFVETARNARSLFVSEKANKYALAMSPYYTREFPRLLTTPPPAGAPRPGPSNAHVTSLGKLDGLLKEKYEGPNGSVGLQDLWVALDIMTPDVLVAVWTLGGRLTMQADYNEAFHSGESMRRFLTQIKKEFEDGLGIKVNPEILRPGQEAYSKRQTGNYADVVRTSENAWGSEPCNPVE